MSKVYAVGIGPGDKLQMTFQAEEVLKKCPVIVGYTVYVDLLKAEFPDKIFITTPMTQETKRCRIAFEEALKGQDVAMVCSGDAGVYGMAGLLYEVGIDYPGVEIETISGLTAACAGAAVLGAPLMHDFTVISLSDRLTLWEKIEKRLQAAAMADFCICLYNPSSKSRHDYLKKACLILLKEKKEETVCGIVRNIGRAGEMYQVMTLGELKDTAVDMFTTVFIGNEQTKIIEGRMVTPRGYCDV